MELSRQFPFVFPNGLQISSFSAACEKCGQAVAAERIDGEIVRWGAHIAVIQGIACCANCDHHMAIETKVRDDKSVYYRTRGEWMHAESGFRSGCRKVSAALVDEENLKLLAAFLFSWVVLMTAVSAIQIPAKIVVHKGIVYSVAGMGKTKGTLQAFPVDGDTPIEIPARVQRVI